MKKNIKLLVILITIFLVSFTIGCQRKIDKSQYLKVKIIELDKMGWEAWKNKTENGLRQIQQRISSQLAQTV